MGFPDDDAEDQKTLVEQILAKTGQEAGERKTADEKEKQERIEAINTEKAGRIAGDAREKSERQAEIATERARINQFTKLAAGSTTGDAELIDGRTDVDGEVTIPTSDTVLLEGDRLLVITTEAEEESLRILFGEEEKVDWNKKDIDWNAIDSQLVSQRIVVK